MTKIIVKRIKVVVDFLAKNFLNNIDIKKIEATSDIVYRPNINGENRSRKMPQIKPINNPVFSS